MQYRLSKQAERNLEDLLIDGILTFGKIQREHRRFIHGSHVIFYKPRLYCYYHDC